MCWNINVCAISTGILKKISHVSVGFAPLIGNKGLKVTFGIMHLITMAHFYHIAYIARYICVVHVYIYMCVK